MLRWVRTARLPVPCWIPALAWLAAGILAALGARFALDCRLTISAAGLFTALTVTGLRRRMDTHRRHHRRTDRQLGIIVWLIRRGFIRDNAEDRIPDGLLDERAQREGADVVELKPRATPAHRRQRSR